MFKKRLQTCVVPLRKCFVVVQYVKHRCSIKVCKLFKFRVQLEPYSLRCLLGPLRDGPWWCRENVIFGLLINTLLNADLLTKCYDRCDKGISLSIKGSTPMVWLMSMYLKSSLPQIIQRMFCFSNFYIFSQGLITGLADTKVILLRHFLSELDIQFWLFILICRCQQD